MKKKDFNYGLALLRMFACFGVVCAHFWNKETVSIGFLPFANFIGNSVIIFMITSFYFNEHFLTQSNNGELRKRMFRIIWPLVGWAIIYFVCYGITNTIFDTNSTLRIQDLFWQMFTGHSASLNPSMWFNFVLVVLTLLFFFICKVKNKRITIVVFACIGISAYILQYTEINYAIFNNLRYELKYPLGRIAEMIPCAVAGYLISYYHIPQLLKKHKTIRICVLVSSLVLSILMLLYSFGLPDVHNQFLYSGIKKLFVGIFVFIFAALIPFGEENSKLKSIIQYMTKHTMGIYCCHRLVASYLNFILKKLGFESDTFLSCVLIYLCCFVFIELLSKVPVKFVKQLCD